MAWRFREEVYTSMTRTNRKWILLYGAILPLELLLWLCRRGEDQAILLLYGVLLGFGWCAALGDLREKRVSNTLVAALLSAWILILVPQLFYRTEYALWLLLRGGVGFLMAGVLFLTVYLVSRRGLGGGDVKFMAVSGLFLGTDVLPAMLYGSILSALAGIGLLVAKKIGRRDAIPLVPFLLAGMLIVIFTQQ